MAPVVVIRATEGRHILESPLPKILPELRVIPGLMAYVMITRKNTIRNVSFLQNLHVPVSFLPLILLIGFIHDISCMDYIFQVQALFVVSYPFYIFTVNVRVAL
ncbi:hypothetical protein D3C75_524880 [compost metagenome]